MASQRITIAKIAGEAGLAAISRFREWSGLRVSKDHEEWGPAQWPVFAREEIDTFASALQIHGHELPVVYFNEHVDFWLMGGDYQRWLGPADGPRAIEVHSDLLQAWCYSLPDGGALADRLQTMRDRKQNSPEERWFRDRLLEAVLAWTPLVEVAAICVFREVLGGLVEDLEVTESLRRVPDWIG